MNRRALLVLLLLASACGGDEFDPYARLKALRVLAIRSEPVAPASGQSTTLTPLVYVPEGAPEPTFAWSWCPFTASAADGAQCPIDEAELQQLSGAGISLPPFDLGTGASATFENRFTPELIQLACSGGGMAEALGLLDCDQGLPVQIKLTVQSGDQQVVSIRRLRLRGEMDPGDTNPRLDGLGVAIDDMPRELPEALTDDTPTVTRKKETMLLASLSEDEAERYTGRDDRDQPIETREQLILSWFVDNGDLDTSRTSYAEGSLSIESAQKNLWKPASVKDFPGEASRVLLVLRDDRDGVDWRGGVVRLVEETK